MTPAYEREPYRTELATHVVATGEEAGRPFAVLEDTLLYPEGGGQPADQGWLGEVAVLDVQRRDTEIRHYLASSVEPGPVALRLDWARRFDHMQQHTGQHLLSAVAAERFGWETTSFHLGRERSDVELAVPAIDGAALASLEGAVAAEVRAARPVRVQRVAQECWEQRVTRARGLPAGHQGDVRLVEIEGLDTTPCGGTHLASTAEIEAIKLLATEPMRGGTRLHWLAGARVRRRLGELTQRLDGLRSLLGVGESDLEPAMVRTLDELAAVRRQSESLGERWMEAVARSLATAGEPLVDVHLDDADGTLLRRLAALLAELAPRQTALLTASRGDQHAFAVVAPAGREAGPLGAAVAARLGGRGGGRGSVFQGRAAALDLRPEALAVLRELLATVGAGAPSEPAD